MEIQSLRSTTENYPAVYKRYVYDDTAAITASILPGLTVRTVSLFRCVQASL